MTANRSVPADTLVAHVFYDDLHAAIAWLTRVFGFQVRFRYGEPTQGAQLALERAIVMVSIRREGRASPATLGARTGMLTIFVDALEDHYEQVRAAGAIIVEPLNETVYGELQYVAADPEGHHWLFARHARDVAPEAWGARA